VSAHRGRLLGSALAAMLVASSLGAQVVRTPSTASARIAQHDSATSMYEVGGIRVIHRLTGNDVVAANIYLLGGVRQITDRNAGIEALLLDASERGTKDYPKEKLRRAIAKLGSSVVVSPSADWTVLGARATRATFDSTWMILANRLMFPTLDASEVAQAKEQFLTAVRQRGDSPDALVEFVADSFAFTGHPYARQPVGTEASLSSITADDLRRYQAEQIVKSRMLLVIVGNVPRAKVEQLVQRTIAKLPAGTYTWTLPDTMSTRAAGIAFEARSLPTNYILGYYAGPPAGSKDYQALRVATAVLSGQLFAEIRSRRNLTYAVDAPFIERALAAGGLYVTTVSPDTTLAVMRQQIEALQEGMIDPEALQRLVQQFITEYFLNNETNAEQADFLVRAQLYRGDYRAAERFVDELRNVTPQDVQRVARKYMRNIRFAYVGDPSKISLSKSLGTSRGR
jgi:zinc protease